MVAIPIGLVMKANAPDTAAIPPETNLLTTSTAFMAPLIPSNATTSAAITPTNVANVSWLLSIQSDNPFNASATTSIAPTKASPRKSATGFKMLSQRSCANGARASIAE